jgi:hypothetical protein
MSCICCSYEITIGGHSDPWSIRYLLEAHKNENLTELIVRSHTLLTNVISQLIVEKQGKPWEQEKDGNKFKFYAGLMHLPEEQKRKLLAFAKLRHRAAHELVDEHALVWKDLPWKHEQRRTTDTLTYVLMEVLSLLEALGVLTNNGNGGSNSNGTFSNELPVPKLKSLGQC